MTTPEPYDDPTAARIRSLTRSVTAPTGLGADIVVRAEEMAARRRRRRALLGGGALAAGAAAVVTALVLSAGSATGPGVLDAAALAEKGPTAPAPPRDAADPGALARDVEGVAFPAWSGPLPWRPSGQRTDRLSGRLAGTVFYTGPRRTRLAYTIVGGPVLAWPQGARRVRRAGVEVYLTRSGGSVIATWREGGHQCVISAPRLVPDRAMIALAASSGGPAGGDQGDGAPPSSGYSIEA
jgi:hypothetical protein